MASTTENSFLTAARAFLAQSDKKKRSHSDMMEEDVEKKPAAKRDPSSAPERETTPASTPPDSHKDTRWKQVLKRFPRCCASTGIQETSVFRHRHPPNSRVSASCLRQLMAELGNLNETLPEDPSIFVRFDEEMPQFMRCLITAPSDTPYALGLFCFDIFIPSSYPQEPPKMKLLTTGGGKVRFSPNLYADGTVCLSLLNTWQGPKWVGGQSTILQVLVSIQGLILGVLHPYYLEPGNGGWSGRTSHKSGADKEPAHVRQYENIIREGTLKYAILEMLRRPPKCMECFQDIVPAHFYHHRTRILDEVRQWVENWTAMYSGQKNRLEEPVAKVEEEFSRLKPPALLEDSGSAQDDASKADNQGGNTEAFADDVAARTRSLLQQAVAEQDYITAGRLQMELAHIEKQGGTVACRIAAKRQTMENFALTKDYISAGQIQAEIQYLEQNQQLLSDLERRMFEAAAHVDFVKAGKIQEQYRVLLQSPNPTVSSAATTAKASAQQLFDQSDVYEEDEYGYEEDSYPGDY